jgi:FKBP-type peptidyl-prolyl cis-trans isomerase FkpA
MKKSILFLGMATALIMSSCQQFKKGDGGMEYNIIKDAGNAKAVPGDVVVFDFTMKTDHDTVMTSSYETFMPAVFQLPGLEDPQNYAGGYLSAIRMLGEGDSAIFKINVDTLVAKTGSPRPPDSIDQFIVFTVKVHKNFQKGDLTDSALNSHVTEYMEARLQQLKESEPARIDAYVSENKLKTTKTASGLQYVVEKEGDGVKLTPGDSVVVEYTGSVIGGITFDTSIEEVAKKHKLYNQMRTYEPASFPVGSNMMLPGWEEGIQLMSKGAKYKLIIPSSLGYGEFGQQMVRIPQYAPLVFDVEIKDVKKGTGVIPEPAQ